MKLPKEVLVYVCDYEKDSSPIYSVAVNVDDIPESYDGEKVGSYTLTRIATFKVKRELKP